MKKYYYAGSTRVAMRTGSTTDPTTNLIYLLGDHLGSTNVTANNLGAWVSEIRYKPLGRIRYTYAIVLLLDMLEIFLELVGVDYRSHYAPSLSNNASTLSALCKFFPASVSSRAWRVSAFGMATANNMFFGLDTYLNSAILGVWVI